MSKIGREAEAAERMAQALERLADSFSSIASTVDRIYNSAYPPRREVRDADITHLKNDQDRAAEENGDTGESEEEWIGLRETQFLEDQTKAEKKPRRPSPPRR